MPGFYLIIICGGSWEMVIVGRKTGGAFLLIRSRILCIGQMQDFSAGRQLPIGMDDLELSRFKCELTAKRKLLRSGTILLKLFPPL